MAEEIPGSDVSKVIEEDNKEMECESSDIKSTQTSETDEEPDRRAALTLLTLGATSTSGTPSGTETASDSDCAKSPGGTYGQEAVVSPSESSVPSALTSPISDGPSVKTDVLSPGKEKGGFLKGVKTAIRTTAKSVWKKISPKKSDKAALAVNTQEESEEACGPALPVVTEKSGTAAVGTRCTKNRGSLVLNSVASEETTLLTSLGRSSSDVFLPDDERRESVATCDTATHASRLPSLDESISGNDPGEATRKQVSGHKRLNDPNDEDTDDGNEDVTASPCKRKEHEE